MSTVYAVLLVVACAPDLLICQDVHHPHWAWASVAGCDMDKDRLIQRLATERELRGVVMGKCKLFLRDVGFNEAPIVMDDTSPSFARMF